MKKQRPTLPRLGELIEQYGGNVSRLADNLGYSPKQIHRWIADAPDLARIGLLEKLATARATEQRARLLRSDVPAFIIPAEIKTLVGLFYRLSWDELQALDVQDILNLMDCDPDAPRSLRYKMDWADLRNCLTEIDNSDTAVCGVHYHAWNQHVLMAWVGLCDQSPLWSTHEDLPRVVDDNLRAVGVHLETTVRKLIQLLEKYL